MGFLFFIYIYTSFYLIKIRLNNDIIIMNMEKIYIESEYIKLSQFLKFIDLIFSGGEAKIFLENNEILINGEKDNRKGRKLYKGDIVEILGKQYQIC